ncbi:uncharacterized protein SCHCODRAFT_02629104 [Schizophyllum commune H4-8]|uniref:uncharacterized protein n=1 Tax=Schizophyllum commune (strain H4-8 / FGSC 9210) TaxID=578458 RepID=UPI00215FA63D|nr:uncharacterized protein SCHCODRAFT_02629104 [Schizophyllum commune H4-8]KAI5891437.1 hypothetical protein SCHCODRAFT_02629104 [Schizophyllum commune H4-8]
MSGNAWAPPSSFVHLFSMLWSVRRMCASDCFALDARSKDIARTLVVRALLTLRWPTDIETTSGGFEDIEDSTFRGY